MHRTAVSVAVAAILAATLAAACLFPSLAGMGGPGDASTPDGTADGSALPDGSPADASFCGTHPGHTFCEDFDQPSFAAHWGTVAAAGPDASVTADDAAATSPPNSLLATTTSPAYSYFASAYVGKHFAAASHITVQFGLRIDTSPTVPGDVLRVTMSPAPAGYSTYMIALRTQSGATTVDTSMTTADGGIFPSLAAPVGEGFLAWHTVRLDLDTLLATCAVTVDGSVAASLQLPAWSASPFDLSLGVPHVENATPTVTSVTVHVDDVLVDIDGG